MQAYGVAHFQHLPRDDAMFGKNKTPRPGADPTEAAGGPNGQGRKAWHNGSQARHSILSKDLEIVGDLHSDGDISLEGRVAGNIQCRTLTLTGTPAIEGDVNAETIRVCGSFGGHIEANKVHLTKTAEVTGDISYRSLAIDEGASFEGTLARRKGPPEPSTAANGTNDTGA